MCVSDHIKQPAELHIYQMAGHGFGMKKWESLLIP